MFYKNDIPRDQVAVTRQCRIGRTFLTLLMSLKLLLPKMGFVKPRINEFGYIETTIPTARGVLELPRNEAP